MPVEHVLEVDKVRKRFGTLTAVDGISFQVQRGSFVTLLGPSGCGKTTTLRLIAGFERPDAGRIILNGEDIQGKPPFARNVNTVFQNYALFPHMTVFENIAFGMESRGRSKEEIVEEVHGALALINMPEHGSRYPNQLSGGQRQRVAVARAFVNKPDLLLLDEPLGALDLKLRQHMQIELKRLQQDLGIAFVYVTHDQEEALTMSDRVVVMNHAVVEQIDDPVSLYHKPRTQFVADFLGGTNLLPVTMREDRKDGTYVEFCDLSMVLPQKPNVSAGQASMISIRPEKLVTGSQAEALPHQLRGTITDVIFKGIYYEIVVSLENGTPLTSKAMLATEHPQIGSAVTIGFRSEDVVMVGEPEAGRQ